MSKKLPVPALPANPATVSQARRQVIIGGLLAFLGVISAAIGVWGAGLIFMAVGALTLVLSGWTRRVGGAVVVVNRSLDAITRGRLAEAESMLDGVEPQVGVEYVKRVIQVQRTLIAFRRGRVAEALEHADAAVTRPLSLVGRGQDRVQIAAARGIRALLRAMNGDESGAREDVALVRASGESQPEALARAELAEAILLERSGDREALRKHLTEARGLLLEHSAPRERAVVRAYQRMLEARRSSIYREGAPREPEQRGDEPTIADWMAAVVPGAAPFARSRAAVPLPAETAAPAPAEPIDPKAQRAAEARVKPTRRAGKIFLIYLGLIGMFVSIWTFLSPSSNPQRAPSPSVEPVGSSDPSILFTIILPVVVAVGLVVALRFHAHKRAQQIFAALVAIARGDEERGEAGLRTLSKSRYPVIAGRAWLELAALAERRTDFKEALAACDRGLKALSVNTAVQAVASAILLPELLTEWALILAATDRDQEAGAELALLAERYPAYPFRSRAELRVGMVRRVRRGDLAGAASLVAQGTDDIPLTLRDEALADVVRAAVHPGAAGAGEVERVKRELRSDAKLRRWLEAVAPTALSAFHAAEKADERDEEAEREAQAEEAEQEAEALAGSSRSAKMRPE